MNDETGYIRGKVQVVHTIGWCDCLILLGVFFTTLVWLYGILTM